MENWEPQQINIDPNRIFVSLPHVRAKDSIGCGVAACRSLGRYFGIGPKTEGAWRKRLGTDEYGTPPSNIVYFLRELGLTVRVKKNASLEELFETLDLGYPVLCPIQAYGCFSYSSGRWRPHQSYKDLWCGHWVIAIGYDEKYIYFEDSYVKRNRSFITYGKMLARWHDIDRNGREYEKLMLTVIGKPKKPINLYKAKKVW